MYLGPHKEPASALWMQSVFIHFRLLKMRFGNVWANLNSNITINLIISEVCHPLPTNAGFLPWWCSPSLYCSCRHFLPVLKAFCLQEVKVMLSWIQVGALSIPLLCFKTSHGCFFRSTCTIKHCPWAESKQIISSNKQTLQLRVTQGH